MTKLYYQRLEKPPTLAAGELTAEEDASLSLYPAAHLHAALICFAAGRADNAATWLERDLGELDPSPLRVDPASLRLVRFRDGLALVWDYLYPPALGEHI